MGTGLNPGLLAESHACLSDLVPLRDSEAASKRPPKNRARRLRCLVLFPGHASR